MNEPIEGRIARRLADLSRFGGEAEFIGSHGYEAYTARTEQGALLRNAGERILIKVATVVEKLPADYKDDHPEIDWTGITRMHNLVSHHYDKVNDDLLWRALTVRIPGLITSLGL
ncbi:HepT-like ribonuclease domain-containing protein [Actinomyces bowdenii]|uniref:DUF86 domain-containing protein n=1 Tax=Actinomyces bowdenii TaxID=131109 RepID=A0A853EKL0_9ACTO|nr:HepT-like ribonuclease domain-containing protein [Actinomyces bowdenii]MBF0696213.1 DUF86 domain-containing protein [Actinomyces bowdenii]NYS68386.1 DUF86 domain-containing protein [Actinomyces bowdenii]